jgi:hypothetical protein
LYIHF